MAKKKYYWLRLKDDFFRQKEIKKLRKIAGGDTYTIIYLKMLLIAMKNDNKIYFEGVEENFAEELALELDEDTNNVGMTLSFLQSQSLIEMIDEDEYLLPKCKEMVGSESSSAERVRKHRLKKKEEENLLQCNASVTDGNAIVKNSNTEKEKEKEKHTEKEQQQEINIQKYIEEYLKITSQEAGVVVNVCRRYSKDKDVVVVVKEKWKIISNGNFNNPIGALLKAIKEDWKQSNIKTTSRGADLRFNDFQQREYDYDSLEKKLLGWDEDQ